MSIFQCGRSRRSIAARKYLSIVLYTTQDKTGLKRHTSLGNRTRVRSQRQQGMLDVAGRFCGKEKKLIHVALVEKPHKVPSTFSFNILIFEQWGCRIKENLVSGETRYCV